MLDRAPATEAVGNNQLVAGRDMTVQRGPFSLSADEPIRRYRTGKLAKHADSANLGGLVPVFIFAIILASPPAVPGTVNLPP